MVATLFLNPVDDRKRAATKGNQSMQHAVARFAQCLRGAFSV